MAAWFHCVRTRQERHQRPSADDGKHRKEQQRNRDQQQRAEQHNRYQQQRQE
jgi:hypothetical protein